MDLSAWSAGADRCCSRLARDGGLDSVWHSGEGRATEDANSAWQGAQGRSGAAQRGGVALSSPKHPKTAHKKATSSLEKIHGSLLGNSSRSLKAPKEPTPWAPLKRKFPHHGVCQDADQCVWRWQVSLSTPTSQYCGGSEIETIMTSKNSNIY